MSYPPPRHLDDAGAVRAAFRAADDPPELTYANGTTVRYLATGASTDGRFGLYRWDMGAEPSGPSPHFHRTIAESFFVLVGTVRIYDGDVWRDATPGDFVHVPEGGVHAFRNESGAPASLLIHFAPGAPREAYFEGLAHLADLTDDERARFFVEHDNIWV